MKSENPSLPAKLRKSKPPVPVLLVCIFEFLGLMAIPHAVFSEKSASIGLWYQVYVGLTALMTIAIIYFLWRMKITGVVIYIGAYFIHNVVAVAAGNWMWAVVLIPAVGLLLMGVCWRRFRKAGGDGGAVGLKT